MITYSATLDVPADTATQLVELLVAERCRRGTGIGARRLLPRAGGAGAALVPRGHRHADPGRDAGVSTATGYRFLHEDIDVLAAQAPEPHQVLRAGRAAGGSPVTLDGTSHRHRPLSDQEPGHRL